MISYNGVGDKLKPILNKVFCRTLVCVLGREDIDDLIEAGKLETSLSFVSSEEILELNRTYRDIDRPTDVLSFPMYETLLELSEAIYETQERVDFSISIGDVVICEDIAKKQAEEIGQSFEKEVVYLFIHSLLHLLGYDHADEEEKADMRAIEKDILTTVSIE
jgi:probable rRNA maturation factor